MTAKCHFPILHVFERLWRAFRYPPIIAFRRQKNLKDLLVWATLTSTRSELRGNYQCGVSRCKTCPILRAMDEFFSHTTGKSYNVKFHASCKSSNIVYLITCRRCGLQYMGETSQPLNVGINCYRSDITHQRTDVSPVAKHFNRGAHSISVMVIELSISSDPCLWKVKEGRWIRTLETSFPSEMNHRVDNLWNLTSSSSVQLWVSCPSQSFMTSPSPED